MGLLVSLTTNATAAITLSPSSAKREQKIEARIANLKATLEKEEQALSEMRVERGYVAPKEDSNHADSNSEKKMICVGAPLDYVEGDKKEPQITLPNPTVEFNPAQIDSLLEVWRVRESQDLYNIFFNQYILIEPEENKGVKEHIDTIYKRRLLKLASPIELAYNSIVRGYINRYTDPRYRLMDYIIPRTEYYFPIIEEELHRAGLPVELRMLAVVESALTTTNVSHAGAAGLWQFMPFTGKQYGLEVNSLVDERYDPAKSTVAACRFLSDLYKIYNNWGLALAAYNCGPGNVNKAIARSGLKEGSYWDIYDYLPKETRGYVPAFIGASYAYAYHKEYDVKFVEQPLPLATDTITVNRILHFGQVAETIDLPIDVIRRLNPQYRRDIIPATTKSYSLRLPQRYVSAFIEHEEQIHAKDSTFLKQYINPSNLDKLRKTTSGRTVHTVRSGDTLSGIAVKYNTTVKKLLTINKLRSADRLSLGQKIVVRE